MPRRAVSASLRGDVGGEQRHGDDLVTLLNRAQVGLIPDLGIMWSGSQGLVRSRLSRPEDTLQTLVRTVAKGGINVVLDAMLSARIPGVTGLCVVEEPHHAVPVDEDNEAGCRETPRIAIALPTSPAASRSSR